MLHCLMEMYSYSCYLWLLLNKLVYTQIQQNTAMWKRKENATLSKLYMSYRIKINNYSVKKSFKIVPGLQKISSFFVCLFIFYESFLPSGSLQSNNLI